MEGKLSKKGAAKDTIKGTKQKIHWEPDHTQIDDVITDEGVPQQGDEPAPHPPLYPLEEQREEEKEQADPFLCMERPPGIIT
jgi:hypothetical protein